MGWREIKARMEKAGITGPIKEDWAENPLTSRVIEAWEETRPRAIAKLRAKSRII